MDDNTQVPVTDSQLPVDPAQDMSSPVQGDEPVVPAEESEEEPMLGEVPTTEVPAEESEEESFEGEESVPGDTTL